MDLTNGGRGVNGGVVRRNGQAWAGMGRNGEVIWKVEGGMFADVCFG